MLSMNRLIVVVQSKENSVSYKRVKYEEQNEKCFKINLRYANKMTPGG